MEIKLYEPIGGFFGIDAKEFTDQIPADETEITVRINSPGGTVSDGLAIYNYLKGHQAHVTTIVDGYAASSASVVMMAGDERRAHKSSFVMVHNPWAMTAGNADDLRHQADVLDEHGAALLDIYKNVTGKDEDSLREMMKEETWMRGEAAMENGFATHVVDETAETKAAAALAWSTMFDAIQNCKELDKMSSNPTKKEVAADRDEHKTRADELQAKVDEFDATVETARAEVRTELQSEIEAAIGGRAEVDAELEASRASVEILTAENTASGEVIATHESTIAEQGKAIETAQASVDESAKTITTLEAKLANPAHEDADLTNAAIEAQSAADAEADELEAKAREKAENEATEPGNAWESYSAMEAGPERIAYWNENKREILATEPTNE